MTAATITYEQPLNEQIRICLRLEHLFKQLRLHLENPSVPDSHQAMITLMKLLNVTNRPDLKSKLSQTLSQQASLLAQLETAPNVDTDKLQDTLYQLDTLNDQLHHVTGKIGDPLRNNPFLNQIRMHLSHPGGPCSFSTPAYALWLQQPSEKRIDDLKKWTQGLTQLNSIEKIILKLTRESTNKQKLTASNGFYQQSLDANLPCQMIRVTLPMALGAYPEISVGKHRMAIRFLKLNFDNYEHAQQIRDDFEFTLNCCRI
ncbi:cell division protein ZapD [Candidiatus Paracoxiella cheracis]|uniref:cell division protein ZapD n=1 Tax=Candidiatus Paracoxiella cheracis TaxID=3405120 RepID=UPI003BF4EDFA